MDNVGNRIKELRKSLGLTQAEFGNRLGVKGNTIATYELGRNAPIDAVLTLMCKTFNVSKNWLLTGEGEMYIEKDEALSRYVSDITDGDDKFIKDFIMTYMELDDASKQALRKMAENMAEKYKEKEQ